MMAAMGNPITRQSLPHYFELVHAQVEEKEMAHVDARDKMFCCITLVIISGTLIGVGNYFFFLDLDDTLQIAIGVSLGVFTGASTVATFTYWKKMKDFSKSMEDDQRTLDCGEITLLAINQINGLIRNHERPEETWVKMEALKKYHEAYGDHVIHIIPKDYGNAEIRVNEVEEDQQEGQQPGGVEE